MVKTEELKETYAQRLFEYLRYAGKYHPADINGKALKKVADLDVIGIVRPISEKECEHLLLGCGHSKGDWVHLANVYFQGENWDIRYWGFDFMEEIEFLAEELGREFNVVVTRFRLSGTPKFVHEESE